MVDIYSLRPRGIKERHSQVKECQFKKAHKCRGKFIQTHEGQENCLMCERLVPPALHIAARQGEVQSNWNTTLNIDSHFAEASVSTTGGSVESRGRKITPKQREYNRIKTAEYRTKNLERVRTINREYARRKRTKTRTLGKLT